MNLTSQPGHNNDLIQKLTQIVLENLNNEQFGVSKLAEQVGMNRSHLYRKVLVLTKKNLSQFIREIRLAEALKLLKEETVTVSEVAYRVGFNNPTYFSTCFHDHYGFPPGEAKPGSLKETLQYKNSEANSGKHQFIFGKKYAFIALFFFLLIASMATVFFLKRDKDAIQEKSIAVLPFINLSEEKGNEHFVDGLVEDLLNRISVIEELKVTSRTSSEMYRERGLKSVSKISAELGVTYIVEGSVQRYGDKVRVIVQLIDAINDDHIWVEKYDRNMKDVFKVQSEIAMHIASELDMILTPVQKIHLQENRTKNVKALELYQMGLFFWNKRTGDGYEKSIEYFEEAIKEDPTYGLAYAGLADTYHLMAIQGWMDRHEGRDKAVELALKALELDETLSEAYTVLATLSDFVDRDWGKAELRFARALELNPNYSTAHHYYSNHLSILGQHEEARKHINIAIELDPVSFVNHQSSMAYYYHRGQFKEALAELQKCQELHENHPQNIWKEVKIYWQLGEEEKSYEALVRFLKQKSNYDLEIANDIYKDSGLRSVLVWKLKIDEANDAIQRSSIASNYGMIGEDEKALEWLEKGVLLPDDVGVYTSFNIHYKNLHKNPRFHAILKEMGLEAQITDGL